MRLRVRLIFFSVVGLLAPRLRCSLRQATPARAAARDATAKRARPAHTGLCVSDDEDKLALERTNALRANKVVLLLI